MTWMRAMNIRGGSNFLHDPEERERILKETLKRYQKDKEYQREMRKARRARRRLLPYTSKELAQRKREEKRKLQEAVENTRKEEQS